MTRPRFTKEQIIAILRRALEVLRVDKLAEQFRRIVADGFGDLTELDHV